MPEDRRSTRLSLIQFLAIIAVTLSLSLIVDFGRKATASYRVRQNEIKLAQEVAELEARQQALKERKALLQSDAFVEQWARQEMHLVRSGETAVMPVIPRPVQSAKTQEGRQPVEGVEEQELPCWQVWWALFMGSAPGS
ncbi:MAG: septum formation initiator family protein [Anaerolineae bacterium]|nr:septum formation initiator family protein [Anaerolineae bacterium]